MRTLVVEPEAQEELGASIDWYDEQEDGLGGALLAEIDTVIDGLQRGELRGSGVPALRGDVRVRRVLLDRFPYAVVFMEHADVVHVLAFAHQRRRPDYWKHRVPT